MAFGAPFGRVFSPTFDRRNAVAAGNWWDGFGAIPGANVLMAFQPKGAVSYAASKSNLANPGTYDATNGAAFPAWAAATGWTFTAASSQYLVLGGGTGPTLKPFTILVRVTPAGAGTTRNIIGGAVNTGSTLSLTTLNVQRGRVNNVTFATSSTAVTTDNAIGMTYSAAGVFTYYLNGVADGTGTNDQIPATDTDRIGGAPVGYYDGVISAISVYNIDLSAAQVAAVHTGMLAL